MMNYPELDQKIKENVSLDFGDILSKSIELFKKTWLKGFQHLLWTFLVFIIIMMLIMLPLVLIGVFDSYQFDSNEPSPLIILSLFLTMLPAIFLASTFVMLLNAAFFRIIKQIDLNEPASSVSFGMFMKGKYIKKALLLSCATTLIFLIAFSACYIPIFYVMVPITLLGVIFAFNPDMEVSELLKLSFSLGNKKWLITFGLILVAGLIAELGVFACGVGVLFTASFVSLPTYFIYKDAIGFNVKSPIEKIGLE